MPTPRKPPRKLLHRERRQIFAAIVAAQDSGLFTLAGSRRWAMKRFRITARQLEAIERDGVARDWPPLDG